MLAKDKEKRQKALMECIKTLSKELLADEDTKKNVADELKKIYQKDFRHNYSDFFPLILEMSKEDNEYNIDCLTDNLESLRAFVEADYVKKSGTYNALYPCLEKLCDHINLEIARWSYYSKNENAIKDNVRKIEDIASETEKMNEDVQKAMQNYEKVANELEDAQGKISSATRQLNRASKQAESMQTETIAVLSIFAGIVFAFSGGMTFLGSVMAAITGAEHYEMVVLSATICGMVVFNTIFLLMYLVGKITDRNIYAKCKTDDCSCEKPCMGLKKIRKRLPYVYWLNVMCLIGIVVDCIIWYCDIRGYFGL